MERKGITLVNLDEIAERWQVPVERIKYFITDCDLPVEDDEARGEWFAENSELILEEKRTHHESLIFPRELRPEATETSA
jgi:hypothetical protein